MPTFPKSTSTPKVTVPKGMDYSVSTNKVSSAGSYSKEVRMSAQKPKYQGTK